MKHSRQFPVITSRVGRWMLDLSLPYDLHKRTGIIRSQPHIYLSVSSGITDTPHPPRICPNSVSGEFKKKKKTPSRESLCRRVGLPRGVRCRRRQVSKGSPSRPTASATGRGTRGVTRRRRRGAATGSLPLHLLLPGFFLFLTVDSVFLPQTEGMQPRSPKCQ